MTRIKLLSLVMALLLVVAAFAGCAVKDEQDSSATDENGNGNTNTVVYQDVDVNDAITHKDYASVYSKIGSQVTIDMVEEKDGLAYVTVDGKKYELGMDFLSMAMVYNTAVPEGSEDYKTEEDVYNEWWKLYIQRWNYLVPEIPLYSNQYYDVYNKKIENFVTTPFWGPADAIVASTVNADKNSVILGSTTELSGAFRNSSWGKSSPGSADLDIENLTTGYSTVQTNKDGALIWNMMALEEEPTKTLNEDGTLTYTIKIKEGLVFSNDTPIKAENYLVGLLCNSSTVGVEAGGTGASGLQFVGYSEFRAYTGANADEDGVSKYFEGVKLLGDYEFSVTMAADYAGYYYSMNYASFSPAPMGLYAPDAEIVVDEATKCVGFNDAFYATKVADGKTVYSLVDSIKESLKWNSDLPWSGPYKVSNYNESTLVATLTRNENYIGDTARGTASIDTITYINIESETQLDLFTTGGVDILAGITGADDTKAALAIVNENPDKYAETHYDRAGYGKIGFRADFGPTGMIEVRQAIMHTINRPEFAQTFTGGYGSVVHGPYYEKSVQYTAVKDDIQLNQYTYSKDTAIELLENAGWVWNVDGTEYDATKGGIRYKKLTGYELSPQNITFSTVDGKYKTVKIDGAYYMPLAINWYGTQPNDVTDQLITAWQTSKTATEDIGMYITYTSTTFSTGLYGEYLHDEGSGFDGVWKLNAINFATGFTSAIYDYAFYWTIDPELYDDYSNNYIMDEADFWENYQ